MASTLMRAVCLIALAARAYTNPVLLPTPPPFETGTVTDVETSLVGTPTCTTVLTSIISGFHGNFTPEIAKTVYTETLTEYERIDCRGCALSITTELAKVWGGFGPQQIITATTTAKQASITTLTVCSREATPPTHGQIPRDVEGPEASSSGECTFTKVIVPSPHLLGGGNKTVYTATATTTSHIDCGGCNHIAVSTTGFLHPGPVVPYTATTTASIPVAETAYVCLKSPSVVLPPQSHGIWLTTVSATSSPTASPTATTVTIHKTITQTIYAATVTTARTVTCRPITGPEGQISHGAIPKRKDMASDKETGTPTQVTETVYSTFAVSDPMTWTRTSFYCVGRRPRPTATPIKGTEPPVGVLGRAAKTTPPTHKPVPVSPTGTTITYYFPPRR